MSDVRLKINGLLYGGWKRLRIQRSMEHIAGAFTLEVSDRWVGQDTFRPIKAGQRCAVTIDKEPVVTGYIDDVNPAYDANDHTISVSGRDATSDLIDCSAPSTSFKGRTLLQVAQDFCKPFGVYVRAETDVGPPFERMKSSEGDTVFDVLESAARVRGVLLYSDGLGGLVIGQPGVTLAPTALELGGNILRANATFSMQGRFSEYTVKGQKSGSDFVSGPAASQSKAQAKDTAVGRHRPLTLISEKQADQATAQKRADWEKMVRVGRSRTVTYTVNGWRHAGGLWQPNTLVAVKDSYLGIKATKLITTVNFSLDEQGELTELTVISKSAFSLLPTMEPNDAPGF